MIFDFEAQPSIDAKQIRELSQLEWIRQAKNLLFLGPPGVGKTHLAIAFGQLAIEKGISVAFYSAEELGLLLDSAMTDGTIKHKLLRLSKPKVLIIDEFGYTPFSPASAPLLFRLINSRYEQKSILITSNKPVSEWAAVLGDATLTTAILDRLLHHSEVVVIRGDSYRLLEKRGTFNISSRCWNVSNRVTNGVILKDVFGGQIKVRLTEKGKVDEKTMGRRGRHQQKGRLSELLASIESFVIQELADIRRVHEYMLWYREKRIRIFLG